MSKSSSSRPTKIRAGAAPVDGSSAKGTVDSHHRNVILARLEPKERQLVVPELEFVRLKLHQVLHEVGEGIKSLYLINDGLASVLSVQSDGKSVEVGLIGFEGYAGAPVVFGFKTSAHRVVTQCDGAAFRLDATVLKRLLRQCPNFAIEMQRYAFILGAQSTQLAACNRLHEVEERLARWLLMSHDRIGDRTMPLTQELLGQMLGTRRSTVSMAASMLQKAGVITYTRGNVTILDRAKLEEVSCECYAMIREQSRTWVTEAD